MVSIHFVLLISIIIQVTSAFLALRLIIITHKYWAWVPLAFATGLMAIRRAVSFHRLVVENTIDSVNTTAEIIALLISILVLIGIINIKPILKNLYIAKDNLKDANNRLNKEVEQRRRLEKEAQNNEEKFRKLAEASPTLIWMCDTDAQCTYFNHRWLHFRGRNLEQERGMGWTEGLHPDDKEKTTKQFLEAFKRRESFELEYRLQNKKKEYRWIYDIGNPMYGSDEEFLGYIGSCIDITERKRAEEKLRGAEQQKSLILQTMREKLMFMDIDLKIQWSNKAALDLIDKNKKDIRGVYCYEVWHCRNEPCEECPAIKVLQTKETELGEIKLQDKLFNVHAYPVIEEGKVTGILEAGEDITEQKKAEKELINSEKKFRMFFNENNAVKLIINPETGDIISANKSAKSFYGYPDIESMKIQEINQLSKAEVEEEMQKAFLREKNFFHFRHKLADGKIKHVEAHSTPLEIEGVRYLYTIIQDITDRIQAEEAVKRSEQKFKKIVNTLPQFVSYTDKDLVYRFVNKTYLDFFNLKEEDIVGKKVKQIIGEDSFEKAKPHLDKVLKGEKVHYKEYFTYPAKSSYMEGTLIPEFDSKGEIQGYYAILSDITHHVVNQQILEFSRKRLRGYSEYQQNLLERERDYIAREIHDELGQNITAIRMGLSMMKKQVPRKDRDLFLKLQEMSHITQTTLTKIKKLSTELRPQLIDDMGLMAAIDWYVRNFEKRSGITCHLELPDAEIDFPKDKGIHIYRIIQEGLTNVYKHANADHVEVVIRKYKTSLFIELKDNGKGIEKRDSDKTNALGIIGMEERVSLMEGEFNIQGSKKGTTIQIKIPV